jgi:hypothetical protein
MALVYATDLQHDGEYVKKRGDKFSAKDAKEYFDLDDDGATQLIDDGVVVQENELPENEDDPMSGSYYEMQAAMLAKYEEAGVTPESSDAGSVAKEPLKARGVQSKKDE